MSLWFIYCKCIKELNWELHTFISKRHICRSFRIWDESLWRAPATAPSHTTTHCYKMMYTWHYMAAATATNKQKISVVNIWDQLVKKYFKCHCTNVLTEHNNFFNVHNSLLFLAFWNVIYTYIMCIKIIQMVEGTNGTEKVKKTHPTTEGI